MFRHPQRCQRPARLVACLQLQTHSPSNGSPFGSVFGLIAFWLLPFCLSERENERKTKKNLDEMRY